MSVTNHPLASSASSEMLALGGNAIDGAISALLTLTVVEPMMIGIMGGGTTLLRTASGENVVVDGLSCAPKGASPDCYEPISESWPNYMEVKGRENCVGPRSFAVPGNLKAWHETHAKYGRLSWGRLLGPAIRHAREGFAVSHYFAACLKDALADMANDAAMSAIYLPKGQPLAPGDLLIQKDYAQTLEQIALDGADALWNGSFGTALETWLPKVDTLLTMNDIRTYQAVWRQPVRGSYRGYEIVGPPPPCSGGVHVLQMLKLLEHVDMRALGFGTTASTHLLLEVMKIAASDRAQAMGDPAFIAAPVETLLSAAYATKRWAQIQQSQAGHYTSALPHHESPNTTHVTVADSEGNIVCATHTINSLFGARMVVPGTGVMMNNYMYLFDPHPGNAMSIQPGKRVTSAQSPLIVYKDDRPWFALGLPGGARIYTSALQSVVNLIDHGMSLQQAVEAPRVWTQGQHVELEHHFPDDLRTELTEMGHELCPVPHIGEV
ncbi:gamma-glutamyltransferase [Paenalcaligenes niemegkensis]|uniref:gamma-glutamyltransferase n=1 Tax=Paenalcaligenes niemegkensis TaxID=2895469 RepID=UPI001EE97807|nr:gamma-glutamyltransferase [Paenalcaligenes niemegkensis]MCQ9618000.1 gamma-glutamyltransferase [Paenalcaligenes niemegkensis]